MFKKIMAAALAFACIPLFICVAGADDAAPVPADNTPKRSVPSSYFQGTWKGNWGGFIDSSASQEITLVVGREVREKVFDVKYSWGEVKWRRGTVPAGRLRTEGREQGDKLLVQWENKKGRKFELTLQKEKEDQIKARIEKSGPTGPNDRPVNETFLYRK
jgi:hypothetical protein